MEEITSSEGNRYKLEVQEDCYQFHWWMKDSWFLLYRFERNAETGLPKTSDQKTTNEICKVVHESPGFIPIRDKYIKVALQTNDSNLGKYFKVSIKRPYFSMLLEFEKKYIVLVV